MHAFEGDIYGICVIACNPGECTLSQGNLRLDVRVQNVRNMLSEIGIEPEKILIKHFSKDKPIEDLKEIIDDVINQFKRIEKCKLPTSIA